MLTDGISWVRFPGIWEEGSKLQLKTEIFPSKKFLSVPYFLQPSLQEAVMSVLGQRAGG